MMPGYQDSDSENAYDFFFRFFFPISGNAYYIAKITNKSSDSSKKKNSSRQTREGPPTNITKIMKITNIATISNQVKL